MSDSYLKLHADLGIPDSYGRNGCPPRCKEAKELVEVGPNLVGRMQSLTPAAAAGWQKLVAAAAQDGVTLLIVSGYRSCAYQAGLIRKKLDSGQSLSEILTVNAAPGFSEHHTGRAVDVATPGSRPLTEAFENSPAFDWLGRHAAEHGFSMTYPRNNAFGFIYEPWHWAFAEDPGRA